MTDEGADQPHRTIRYRAETDRNKHTYAAATDERFEEGVLERFLDENVHGFADHSEDIDSELLEYARQ